MTQTIALSQDQWEEARCTRVMLITPDVAASWLLRNSLNRPMTNVYVAELANAMARGEWRENGESIKFAASGALLDGQHRLAAIAKSGCSIRSSVAFGLDEAIFDTLDRAKKRKFADTLASYRVATPSQLAAEFETIHGLTQDCAHDSGADLGRCLVTRPETHPEQAERMVREAMCECGHIERWHPIAACWSPGGDCTCQSFRTSKPAAVKRTFASLSVDQRYAVIYKRDELRNIWGNVEHHSLPYFRQRIAAIGCLTAYIAGDEE